jgi:hypothetical protein
MTERVPGVVYTPAAIAEPMVRIALAPLRGRRDLRICDPACGDGAFLRAAVTVLAEWMPVADARRCLVGVDIDTAALARVALPGATLVAGDALALDWSALGSFDAVVGNPPYIRQERLAKAALRGWESYDGVADLYVYFVELAHRIARPGGRYCLIVPDKWMTAAYGRPLRSFLAAAGSVEGLVDFARAPALFADADAFPCIVWGTVGTRSNPHATRITDAASVADALAQPRDPQAWSDEPWYVETAAESALLARLVRHPRLALTPARGVVTGCNRAFVIDRATRDALLAAEPAAAPIIRPFAKGRDVRRWTMAPIDRYLLVVDRGTSLDALPHVRAHLEQFRAALEPGTGRKPGAYRWCELQDPVGALAASCAPRLFYQDIQTQPACCVAGDVVPDTTVWILPSEDRFLLALLNSPLYGWFARRRFPPALNGAVRPKLDYMRTVPVADPGSARAEIAALVERALAGEPCDGAIADAIYDVYELSRAERALTRN